MGIRYNGITAGKTLHLLLPNAGVAGADVLINFVAGTGNEVIQYFITDAELVTAGVQAGTWSGTVLTDTVANHNVATNTVDGVIDDFYFDGTIVTTDPVLSARIVSHGPLFVAIPSTGFSNASITFEITDEFGAVLPLIGDLILSATGAISGDLTGNLRDVVADDRGPGLYGAVYSPSPAHAIEEVTVKGTATTTTGSVVVVQHVVGVVAVDAALQAAVEAGIAAKLPAGETEIAAAGAAAKNLDAVAVSGGGTNVTADEIDDNRTFFAGNEGYRSRNIITINTFSTGTITLAADFNGAMNPDTAINTVDSVTITDNDDLSTLTATDLRRQKGLRKVNWDVPAIAAKSSHTIKVVVTTTDTQTLSMTGKLTVE